MRGSTVLLEALNENGEETMQKQDSQDGKMSARRSRSSVSEPETMNMVRTLSKMVGPQLGIDVPTLYASSDPEVVLVSEVVGPVRSLTEGELDSAIAKTIAATEALLPHQKMSDWQRSWCIRKTVQIYLDAQDGSIQKAASSLALALIWREKNKDILSGARVPKWVMDTRVLCRDRAGHPLIYGCFTHQNRFPSVKDNIEHVAAVMNMALEKMQGDVTTFGWFWDCHGFRISSNMDPRSTVGFVELIKHPFRDRLRQILVVDAPKAFSMVWNVAQPHLPANIRDKFSFASGAEALDILTEVAGPEVASKVGETMAMNRSKPSIGSGPPSEKID